MTSSLRSPRARSSRCRPSEIVVVVDHNPTLALRLQAALERVTVVENSEQRGLSGARNTGISSTSAEIVAFLDDDARASPRWIEGLVARFLDDQVVAVGGHAEPLWPTGSPAWFPAEFGWVVGCSYTGQPRQTAPVRNPIGCNMSFRREALEQVGGFSHGIGRVGTRAVGCEETELSLRVKEAFPDGIILYDPQVMVEHRVTAERTSTRYFAQRCFAEGLSKSIVASLAGTESGLSSERTYLRRVLPGPSSDTVRRPDRGRSGVGVPGARRHRRGLRHRCWLRLRLGELGAAACDRDASPSTRSSQGGRGRSGSPAAVDLSGPARRPPL